MNTLVTVAGIPLPEPSTYKGYTSTVVDSARNVQGVMIGAVVRDDIAKIEISYKFLTVTQLADILKLFTVSHGGAFINEVEFFDQTTGGWNTRQMYVSDRTAGMFRRDHETGAVLGWVDVSFSFVEV